jgi:hypothetical protein
VRYAIKDRRSDIEKVEQQPGIFPAESRKSVRAAIDRHYTAPPQQTISPAASQSDEP